MELKRERILREDRGFSYIQAVFESDISSAFQGQNVYVEHIPLGTFVVDLSQFVAMTAYGFPPDVYQVARVPSEEDQVKVKKIKDEKRAMNIAQLIDKGILDGTD